MEYITGEEIEAAFKQNYRHYFTGHLERPQKHLTHFEDDIEVGMSFYEDFTADAPHYHPVATEHGYVVCGSIKIRCFDEDGAIISEDELHEGAFFLIRPGVKHASKNAAGTKILFIKAPGGNDKTLFDVDEDTSEWLKKWD